MPYKIIFCIPCLNLGGSEVATLACVKALLAVGYRVSVVCYYESDSVMVRRYKEAGAEVVLLDMQRTGLKGMFKLLLRLRLLFKKQKPDAVHVQYFAPGMVPILAAKAAGVRRIFATVHAAGQAGYGFKSKMMFRFSASLVSHFFCVAKNTEKFWFGSVSDIDKNSDYSRFRHSTIHNCVDVDKYQQIDNVSRTQLCPELNEDHKVIGIVGRLVTLKGHLTLWQAVKEVQKTVPKVKVLVIGAGSDEELFRSQAKELGIEDSIIWQGPVEPERLPHYYHAIDVLAMPSRWEGFGLTAAEAMAAGKPVVGSDVPGLAEVVTDGKTGFLVPVEDSGQLADKLTMLLSDNSLAEKMGNAGLERVRQLFDVSIYNEIFTNAYKDLIG